MDFIDSNVALSGIKVWVFFGKNIEKKHFCHDDKNYCYFWKSDIPAVNLIVGCRNMIKLQTILVSKNQINGERRFH